MEIIDSNTQIDRDRVEKLVAELLTIHGYDITTEGLTNTPKRVAKVFSELWLKGEPPEIATFPANGFCEMIVTNNIPFYSLCEHHLLPFFGTVRIAYRNGGRIIGLSKIDRIVKYFAKGLQTQEYLSHNIMRYFIDKIHPQGIAIHINARHLCKEMRGVCSIGDTDTFEFKGVMEDEPYRNEFMKLCGK